VKVLLTNAVLAPGKRTVTTILRLTGKLRPPLDAVLADEKTQRSTLTVDAWYGEGPREVNVAKDAPRQLTVWPQAHHEAIQSARQRQETPAFKAQYALRSGVESNLSQGIRRFDLRQSRYFGLARPHQQQLLTATAMHIVRVIAWRRDEPLGERRRKLGHFAQLAPQPLSLQTVLC